MPSSPDSTSTLRRIYLAASEINDEAKRSTFLATACGDNTELRLRIERMCATEFDTPNLLVSAIESLAPLTDAIANSAALQAWFDGQDEQGQAERSDTISTDTEELTQTFAQYAVIRKLGEGGMGTVYLAHQQHPVERKVALKVINPGMDSRQVLARFRLEQKALERMNHPNITNVLDAGLSSSGYPFLVMEWVDGVRIDKFCRENSIDLERRLRIFIDVCLAVHHAHQRGIIHRDLKPSNVMIAVIDGKYVPKVIDFGIAKSLDTPSSELTRLTDLSQLIGTPEYMSPEQAAWGEIEIDTRSDVYSLGSLLYMLVTGSPPFDREKLRRAGPVQLRSYLRETQPSRPSQYMISRRNNSAARDARACELPDAEQVLGRVRSELDWIAMKALEKQPERRYDSAGLLANDVQRFLDREVILARPPSIAYRFGRFARRHRLAFGVAAALLFTAMLGGGLAIRSGLHAIAALKQATTLLEVCQLQNMLTSLPRNVLGTMSNELPREADGSFLGTPRQGTKRRVFKNGSLRQLVSNLMEPQPELTLEHPGPIYSFAVAEPTQLLAACCGDGWVYVWDLKMNKVLHRLGPHRGITMAAFSPDAKTLLTGDQDGFLRRWNLDSGIKSYEEGPAETGVATIVWSPTADSVAIAFRYHDVSIRTPDLVETLRIHHENGRVRNHTLLYSADGKVLYAPSKDNGIQVWELARKRLLNYLNPITYESQQLTTADGKTRRLSTAQEAIIDEFSLENLKPEFMCWANQDERWMLVSRWRAGLLGVDTRTGSGWILPCDLSAPNALSCSRDGKRLVIAHTNGTISVRTPTFDAEGMVLAIDESFRFQAHECVHTSYEYPTVARLLSTGALVTGGEDGKVHFWDLDHIAPQREMFDRGIPFVEAMDNEILCLIPSNDQPFAKLVRRSIEPDGERRELADIPFLSVQQTLQKKYFWLFCWQHVKPFAIHQNQKVVAISNLSSIEIHSTDNGERLCSIPAEGALSVAFARDVNRVVVGYQDNYLRVYALSDDFRSHTLVCEWKSVAQEMHIFADGRSVLHRQDTHFVERSTVDGELLKSWPGNYRNFMLNEDESLIAFHSFGLIEVHERLSGKRLFQSPIDAEIKHISFCDNSQILLTLHEDNRLHAWHLATGRALGEFLAPSSDGYVSMGMFFLPNNPGQLAICYKAGDRSDSIKLRTLGTPSRLTNTAVYSTGRPKASEEILKKMRLEN